MFDNLSVTRFGQALTWARNGATVPTSTAEVYGRLDDVVADMHLDILHAREGEGDARQASVALKNHFEHNVRGQGARPVAEQARQNAMRAVLCGTLAGAIDAGLWVGMKQFDNLNLPHGARPDRAALHTEAAQFAGQLRRDRWTPGGADSLAHTVAHSRQACERLAETASQAASPADTLDDLFFTAYIAGAAQASLKRTQMMC